MPEKKKIDVGAVLDAAVRPLVRTRLSKTARYRKRDETGKDIGEDANRLDAAADAGIGKLAAFVESALAGRYPARTAAIGLKKIRDGQGIQDEDLDALIRELEGRGE